MPASGTSKPAALQQKHGRLLPMIAPLGDSLYTEVSRQLRKADPDMQLRREACEKRASPSPRLQAPLCAYCATRTATPASACSVTADVAPRSDKQSA
ncbi:hypothetical protein DPMN_192752 [Dreissena polymorpha]|uniref:Uncharacterized protein n=1 Tax=Dreissena polymorpha TaxID=45954 RepID=A0A9D3Y0X1_DREPO|nr:hypothetical protein DPMN_192752 [Dreissena polymorpha]